MKRRSLILVAALIFLASVLTLASCGKDPIPEKIYIVKDRATEYSIVYSNDGVKHSGQASALLTEVLINFNADMDRYEYTNADKAQDKEILIGATDRRLSKDLKEAVDKKAGAGGVAWGYAYRDGKLAYYANSEDALSLSWQTFFNLIVKEDTVEVMSDLWVVDGMSKAEYDQYLEDEAEREEEEAAKERAQKIAVLRERIAAINTDFGAIPDFTPIYGTPSMQITESHPRVWVNSESLAVIKANMNHIETKTLINLVMRQADLSYTGRLNAIPEGQNHNFTVEGDLATIESLAVIYLVTGDELYGYTAIRAAKNLINTARISPRSTWDDAALYTVSNACSTAMGIVAEVYDWCYDLLSEQDKTFLVKGVLTRLASNLEVANPPSNGGTVTGHSTSALTLRDWPSFAIAVADEFPEIYTYMIGLAENYYAPAANWYYPSGTNFQGTSYGINKTSLHLQSDLLVMTATGEHLYEGFDFEDVMLTYVQYIRPDYEMIRLGDNYSYGASWGYNTDIRPAFYGYLYSKSPVLKAWTMYQTNAFANLTFKSGSLNKMLETSPIKALLLNDPTVRYTDETMFELDLVHYTGAPLSSLIARSAFGDADAWMTYTNICEAYGANHDHLDAGTFQIYYKGVLAPETGIYQTYGTLHDYSWTKQTIANNGLLIYNPKYEATNSKSKTYTGGQSTQDLGENATLDDWLAKQTSRQAVTLGRDYAYDADGNVIYAYISGDITKAYDDDTVDLVMRSTISIATGDPDQPLMFIVYDRVISDDASFKKTFLLHVMEDPTFLGNFESALDSNENKNVTGTNAFYYTNTKGSSGAYEQDIPDDKYNGKLTNTTLLPESVTYTVIGGDGKRFWINGKGNVLSSALGEATESQLVNNLPSAETAWGRVEISPSSSVKDDSFLNVMFVGDADGDTAYVAPVLIKSATHEGAVSYGNCVMFSRSNTAIRDQFSFTASGEGNLNYYVTGLSEGKWEISVDGQRLTDITVKQGSGVASFTAPAGEITLTPKFNELSFELNGGAFEKGAFVPGVYSLGDVLSLPTAVARDNYEFVGWYASADLSGSALAELNGDDIGSVTLYAKWRQVSEKIYFELNDGTAGSSLPTSYPLDVGFALPTDITRVGSTFLGWCLNEDLSDEPITELPDTHSGVTTLYAKWQKEFDAVFFRLNGGMMDVDPIIPRPDSEYVLPTNVIKVGYLFDGWYLDSDLTAKVEKLTGNESGDINLYAKFIRYAESAIFNKDTAALPNPQLGGLKGIQYGDLIMEAEGKALAFVFIPDSTDLTSTRTGNIRIRTNLGRNEVSILKLDNNNILDAKGELIGKYADGKRIEIVMDFDDKELRYYADGLFVKRITDVGFADDISEYNFAGAPTFAYLWQYNAQSSDSDFTSAVIVGDPYAKNKGYNEVNINLNYGNLDGAVPTFYKTHEGLTLPVPTKYGSRFLGWFENEDLSGDPITEIPAGSTKDYTLYAAWEKEFSVILFQLDGGKIEGEFDPAILPGQTVTLPTNVTKEGSIFLGWCADEALTEKITTASSPDGDDVVVYAHFAEYTEYFTLYKDTEGKQVTSSNAYWVRYGDLIAEDPDGCITFSFIPDITDLTSERNGAFRIRTNGGKNPVYILTIKNNNVYDMNGRLITTYESGKQVDVVMDFDDKELRYYVDGKYWDTVTEVGFESDLLLYNFSGGTYPFWQYDAGNLDSDFTVSVLQGDIYRFKSFEGKGYDTINFELYDGVVDGELPTIYSKYAAYTLPVPTKYGSTFMGWYLSADFSGDPITEIPAGMSGALTVYAKWAKEFSVIQLQLGGGKVEGDFDPKIVGTDTVTLPTVVVRKGYIFGGWYKDEALTEKITEISSPDGNDVYVYAEWLEQVCLVQNGTLEHGKYAGEYTYFGDKMTALGTSFVTFRLDLKQNAAFTDCVIRIRTNVRGNEVQILRFKGDNVTTRDGVVLTTADKGDKIEVVMDFAGKTIAYYVNETLLCVEENAIFNDDISLYNFSGMNNALAQLTQDNVTMVNYDEMCFFIGNLY